MNALIRCAIAAVSLLAFSAGSDAAGLTVKPQQIVSKTMAYTLTVKYPRTGNPVIDREIAAWARQERDDFVAYTTRDRYPDMSPWGLVLTYKITRNDAQMFEVWFARAIADDGNHTHFVFTTFVYLMPDAHRVFITEAFAPAAFARMRAFAANHMVSEDPDFGAEVTDGGLAPVPETFEAFTVSPSTITVWFTPEQLGNMTSAGGHATIPLAQLKGLIRPNWRAPQPSFDCAKTSGAVEKAVCADVALARLDREMARQYRIWLQYAGNDAARAQKRSEQLAWLGDRGKQCRAGAMAACLTRLYRARLAYMQKHV